MRLARREMKLAKRVWTNSVERKCVDDHEYDLSAELYKSSDSIYHIFVENGIF